MRLDLSHIQQWIAPQSRVLDLGCGDGVFLNLLYQRQVKGTGLEIDQKNITAAICRGINIEQDMDKGWPISPTRVSIRSDGPCLASGPIP